MVNLSDPNTFRRLDLTFAEAQARYNILADQEEKLDEQNQKLSPRSQQELKQLVDLIKQSKIGNLEGSHPIVRIVGSTTPHYFVKFPDWKVDTYKALNEQITKLPEKGKAIIDAALPENNSWFSAAMDLQRRAVYKSDFMQMLFHSFVANVSLLRSTGLLVQHPENFKELLVLYSKSYGLYQDQVNFNRDVERDTIIIGHISHFKLQELERECGRNLNSNDIKGLLASCKEVYVNEMNANIAYNTQLQGHCDLFISKIIALETDLTKSFEKISNKHQAVQEAIGKIQILTRKEADLNQKKATIQGKFNEFQRRVQMEAASERKQTTSTSTTTTTSGGFWFLSWSNTETHSHEETKIVKDDFHSGEAYQEYLNTKQESIQLATELESAKTDLTNAMIQGGFSQCGLDQAKIQEAADALATALASLTQMRNALHIRKSHATNQINEAKVYLTTNEFKFEKIEHVLGFMRLMMDRVLQKQSTWLESNRQTFTLQYFQNREAKLLMAVTDAISQGALATDAVQKQLKELVPTLTDKKMDEKFQELLYTNKQMSIEYQVS